MIRLLICDDQTIVVEGLRVVLSSTPDIDVVGQAYDGQDAIEQVKHLHPDVVLMDLRMPVMNGVVATRQIRRDHPQTRVLVLTTYASDEWIDGAVRAGADGYIMKDAPPNLLTTAIRNVAEGIPYLAPDITRKVLELLAQSEARTAPDEDVELNTREIEILTLLATGHSTSDIAAKLSLSEGTVRNYISSAITQLDAHGRTQAVVRAIRYGFIKTV
jgi:DNA-binding NarL/FixJ family response regulator